MRRNAGAGGGVGMGAKEPPHLEGYTSRDEETTPDVFEVSGSIKWFDPSKGYGFIAPDEDLPEVLLHVTCLRRGGFQTAYEGARVLCEAVRDFERSAGRPHSQHGRFDGDPSIGIAAAHACRCRPRERLGKSGGEVDQPTERVRLSHSRPANSRHLRAYGDTQTLGLHRAQTWSNRARALRPRTKRADRG